MADELVEKVAKAIEAAFVEETAGFGEEDDRKVALLCARAALAVMSEPTPEMIEAAYEATGCPVSEHGPGPRNREFFTQIYKAMISQGRG